MKVKFTMELYSEYEINDLKTHQLTPEEGAVRFLICTEIINSLCIPDNTVTFKILFLSST